MQYNEIKYVRASEISSYYLCPRLVYFQRRHAQAMNSAAVRADFFKALSHALGSVVLSARPEQALDDAISSVSADSLLIYGDLYGQTIVDSAAEARGMAGQILTGLIREKEQYGEDALMSVLLPSATTATIYSDKLRISGTIDKVVISGGTPMPVIISSSGPPQKGIYASDRIRLAAYTMLLAEKYDVPCPAGAIEYMAGWSLRRAEIRYDDKRKALYARNRVMDMDRGRMPETARGKWCSACGHSATCGVKPSLLSSLFK